MAEEAQNPSLDCSEGSKTNSLSAEKPVEESQGDPSDSQASVSNGSDSEMEKELVEIKVIWNKNKYDLKFPLDSTGADLKQKIHSLTGELFRSLLGGHFATMPPEEILVLSVPC